MTADATETTADYFEIFANRMPIIDVRSPNEFAQGHMPNAINLPILTDSERHQVGLTYKNNGSEAAVDLGYRLLTDRDREERVGAWCQFAKANSDAVVCCWRGGQRSSIAQEWLFAAGVCLPRVEGGTKALRQFGLDTLAKCDSRPWVILGGRTGTGKTILLNHFENSLDLEGLANHRGSAFGALSTPQPMPISFENSLCAALLNKNQCPRLLLEDEGRMIGHLALPTALYDAMQHSPLVLLEAELDERLAITYESYVRGSSSETILSSLDKIKKRLGGLRHQKLRHKIHDAFKADDRECHFSWIEELLKTYYDPMYDFQIERKSERIVFTGNQVEVKAFLTGEYQLV